MTAFPGFPKEGLKFLIDLKANNNRDWFKANKSDFVDHIQIPAQAFVIAFGTELGKSFPNIVYDPTLRGTGSIMKIYRDVRFSKDKTPYKTYLGLRFWEGPSRKEMYSGFFVWLDPSGAGLHVGHYMFSKDYLADYRSAVDNQDMGEELDHILGTLQPDNKIGGEQYKRVPSGYPSDHPRGELLKYKGLHISSPGFSPELVTSPDFLPLCIEKALKLAPLHRWLVKVKADS
jgi:uncharacterized protein (TIGR02453 family)